MKMNPKTKAKWVKALRSGKYKQCTGYMETDKGYCCLGVLREVAKPRTAASYGVTFLQTQNGEYIMLPEYVQRGLASLNDKKVPFEVIAGFIQVTL